MNDQEKRIQELEKWCLQLEASTTIALSGLGVLLALLESNATGPSPHAIPRHELRATYNRLLRQSVEDYLRTQADNNMALASHLRQMLKQQLDGPAQPPSA
jgi:hypothetical protein